MLINWGVQMCVICACPRWWRGSRRSPQPRAARPSARTFSPAWPGPCRWSR